MLRRTIQHDTPTAITISSVSDCSHTTHSSTMTQQSTRINSAANRSVLSTVFRKTDRQCPVCKHSWPFSLEDTEGQGTTKYQSVSAVEKRSLFICIKQTSQKWLTPWKIWSVEELEPLSACSEPRTPQHRPHARGTGIKVEYLKNLPAHP